MTENTTTARKAPTKKAPAKAPAKKADTTAAPKLRWTVEGDRALAGKSVAQSAVAGDREYKIAPDGEKWLGTVTVGRKTTTLSDTTYAAAYRAVQAHHRAASTTKTEAAA